MIRLYDFLKISPKARVYLPLKLYWALIFVLTTLPGHTLPKTFKISDKIEHALAYFGLAFLLFLAFHFKRRHSLTKIAVLTFGIVIAYGAFDEIHQMFVPFRAAEWLDFVADVIGGLLGIWLANFFIIFSLKLENKR